MAREVERRVPWFLWPFYAIWRLVSLVLVATGRFVCGVLGLVLIGAGAVRYGVDVRIPVQGGRREGEDRHRRPDLVHATRIQLGGCRRRCIDHVWSG